MLRELLKNTKLMSKIGNLAKERESDILDIVIFGSSAKGKEKPHDLDLLVIYKKKADSELSYKIKKEFEILGVEIDLVSKTYDELFDASFVVRESYLSEGYSLVRKKLVAEGLGYAPMVIFRYGLGNFNKSQRMRFYYSFYGRNTEGMLKKLRLHKFSERVIISPVEESERVKDYLNSWKIKYLEIPVLMPIRILESEALNQ